MSSFNVRRSFLRIGAVNLFGLPLSRLAKGENQNQERRAARKNATSMILLWLDGAPSTIDMWDPKPDAPDYVRGEFKVIPTRIPGVHLSEHLAKTADILDRCTLIRSCHHNIPEHGPGSQLMLTGHLPSPAIQYPSLGAIVAKMANDEATVPSHVAFDCPIEAIAGYLGTAWNAFELGGINRNLPAGLSLDKNADPSEFAKRVTLRNRLDQSFDRFETDEVASGMKRFQEQATQFLQRDTIRRALDVSNEPQSIHERYGQRSPFGQNAMKARRLVEAGSRFVTVGLSGWDTHANNFPQLRNVLLPQLDLVVSALITDLEERGLLETTIVCCCGEFGRTPNVNGAAGRDHWSKSFSVLIAGGGFRAGLVFGETDKLGHAPNLQPCTPPELCATLLKAMGIDTSTILSTSSGRPIRILEDKAIDDLMS